MMAPIVMALGRGLRAIAALGFLGQSAAALAAASDEADRERQQVEQLLGLPAGGGKPDCDAPAALAFDAGAGRAEGGVPRGGRDCWKFSGNAGAALEVALTAPENNAALSIFEPGWKAEHDSYGMWDFTGRPLPGTEDGKDARGWSGVLPATGDYLVVVGPLGGGSSYKLSLSIK